MTEGTRKAGTEFTRRSEPEPSQMNRETELAGGIGTESQRIGKKMVKRGGLGLNPSVGRWNEPEWSDGGR